MLRGLKPSPSSPVWTPVAVALGSNLGDSLGILRGAIATLGTDPGIQIQGQSHWYQTVAVGPPQPDYINGCVQIITHYPPKLLLDKLLGIEAQSGRIRQEPWGPRTLDLDLLLYGQAVIKTPKLTVPHPRLHERAFVLGPLAEICPHWIHPVSGLAIATLAKTVDYTGVDQLSL